MIRSRSNVIQVLIKDECSVFTISLFWYRRSLTTENSSLLETLDYLKLVRSWKVTDKVASLMNFLTFQISSEKKRNSKPCWGISGGQCEAYLEVKRCWPQRAEQRQLVAFDGPDRGDQDDVEAQQVHLHPHHQGPQAHRQPGVQHSEHNEWGGSSCHLSSETNKTKISWSTCSIDLFPYSSYSRWAVWQQSRWTLRLGPILRADWQTSERRRRDVSTGQDLRV